MRKLLASSLLLLPTALAAVEEFPVEVHGFTSLGYLVTTGNEYIASDSTDGTTEFWEFGLKAAWRPGDHWRIGGQIFARDYGDYDNGRIQLDWLSVAYRDRDWIGVEVGRVKTPFGLYNEELDVDAARVPVFLPEAIYPAQQRDLFVANDGAKVTGYVEAGSAGAFEYALYGGVNQPDDDGSGVASLGAFGLGDELEAEYLTALGTMVHWHTPLEGLGLRLTLSSIFDWEVTGRGDGPFPGTELTNELTIDRYPVVVLSAEYRREDWVFAAEYTQQRGEGEVLTTIEPFGTRIRTDFEDENEGFYLSATWQGIDRLDLYAAVMAQTKDIGDYSDPAESSIALALAARYDLRDNWLIKLEIDRYDGYLDVIAGEDGGAPEEDWWLVAFKTTVDF